MNKLDRILAQVWPDQEFVRMDGFDSSVVGVVTRFGQEPILCYDYGKVIRALMRQGMTFEEAIEWHSFNQEGAWVGESTPCFIHDLTGLLKERKK